MTLYEALLALLISGMFLAMTGKQTMYAFTTYKLMQKKEQILNFEKSIEDTFFALDKYYEKNLEEYKNNDVSLMPFVNKNGYICYRVSSEKVKNIIKRTISKDLLLKVDSDTEICFIIPELNKIKIKYTYLNGTEVEADELVNDYSKVYLGEDTGSGKLNIYKVPIKVEIKAKIFGTPVKGVRELKVLEDMIDEEKTKISFLYNLLKKYDAVRYSDELLNVYPNGLPSEDDIKVPWVVQIFNNDIYAKCKLDKSSGECINISFPTSKSVDEVESQMINKFSLSSDKFVTPFLNKIHIYLLAGKSDLRGEDFSFKGVESPRTSYPSNILTYGVIVEDNEICKKDDFLEGICRKELFYER